jgi:hypothetical protein
MSCLILEWRGSENMAGDGDFQRDVERYKYRKRVRETAERQYEAEKLVSVMMWIYGGVALFFVFASIVSLFDSTPSKRADQVQEDSPTSSVSTATSDGSAERSSTSVGGSGEGVGAEAETETEAGRSVDSFPTVDIGSIPESVDPTLCLNAISKAQARAGRDWVREISTEVAARCRREIEVQRRRDKQ